MALLYIDDKPGGGNCLFVIISSYQRLGRIIDLFIFIRTVLMQRNDFRTTVSYVLDKILIFRFCFFLCERLPSNTTLWGVCNRKG